MYFFSVDDLAKVLFNEEENSLYSFNFYTDGTGLEHCFANKSLFERNKLRCGIIFEFDFSTRKRPRKIITLLPSAAYF